MSARTAWRMRWQIPLNDPRFQDVTDEEILEDLLVCRFYDHVTQPPETQDAEEVAAAMEDPEVKQKIWDHGSKFLLDPDTQRRLAILQGKQPDTKPRKVAP